MSSLGDITSGRIALRSLDGERLAETRAVTGRGTADVSGSSYSTVSAQLEWKEMLIPFLP